MEARYTTNKGMLPDVLLAEMREAFGRSEEYLDQAGTDPVLEQKQEALRMLENATPGQLERVLEALHVPAICAKPDCSGQHQDRGDHQTGIWVCGGSAKR